MSTTSQSISGSLSVGRDTAVGRNATVQGSATISHNLRIKGWLDARNIKGVNKGVFYDDADLKAAYPNGTVPDGSFAICGATLPGELWYVKDGVWTDSGKTAGELTADVEQYLKDIETIETDISDINGDIEAIEKTNNTQDEALTTETSERKAADATLQVNIDTEETARKSADETLQSNINAEASNRETADTALQKEVSALQEEVDKQITTDKLADKSVTAAKIADGAIEGKLGYTPADSSKLGQLASLDIVDAIHLDGSSVTTEKITDEAVSAEKLASLSVTEEKLADESVSTDKLADDAVTEKKIVSKAVKLSHLGDDVTSRLIEVIFVSTWNDTVAAGNASSGYSYNPTQKKLYYNDGSAVSAASLSDEKLYIDTVYDRVFRWTGSDMERIGSYDAEVMHLTGTELVQGEKTFTDLHSAGLTTSGGIVTTGTGSDTEAWNTAGGITKLEELSNIEKLVDEYLGSYILDGETEVTLPSSGTGVNVVVTAYKLDDDGGKFKATLGTQSDGTYITFTYNGVSTATSYNPITVNISKKGVTQITLKNITTGETLATMNILAK